MLQRSDGVRVPRLPLRMEQVVVTEDEHVEVGKSCSAASQAWPDTAIASQRRSQPGAWRL